MDEELDIYLSDLTEGAQKTVLDFLGLKSAKQGNLDILPLASVAKPVEEP